MRSSVSDQIYSILKFFTFLSFSVLPAISMNDGMLHCEIIEGSFCTDMFTSFVSGLLDQMNPFPHANSVIIMDNCRIHKHPDIIEMIESR